MSWLHRLAQTGVILVVVAGGCSSVSTVRVQPESVSVGAGLRPVAVVHAQVSSAYLLFIPIPGDVNLDRVVNRMLIAAAKAMGADKVVNIQVDMTPEGGIWTLRKLAGWRSAYASGIAVVVEDPATTSPAPAPAANSP